MVEIGIDELKKIIATLKGVLPINYEGMARIVAVIDYFEEKLAYQQRKQEEVKDNGG